MKVKTNLTPRELSVVSKGLEKLAEAQVTYEPTKAENPAEEELLTSAKAAFAKAISFLKSDIKKLIK